MQLTELAGGDFARLDAAGLVATGWDEIEDGRRRALSWRSALTMPRPDFAGDLLLVLGVEPFLFPPVLNQQLLRVVVNGTAVALSELQHRTLVLGRIPAALAASRPRLEVSFEHPDVVQPNMISTSADTRGFSVSFRSYSLLGISGEAADRRGAAKVPSSSAPLPPAENLTDEQLLRHFASLGDNCEFGILQRTTGIEVADLLRFAGSRLSGLLRALDGDFDLIDKVDDVEVQIRGPEREYVLSWRQYTMQMHTTVHEGELPVARLLSRELKKLQLQRRLLLADLAAANRIFVYKNLEVPISADIAPLVRRLRRHGPVTLLQVLPAERGHTAGTVESLEPGLMRGYIDRFNPYSDAGAPPSPMWRTLCRAAYGIWREQRVGALADVAAAS